MSELPESLKKQLNNARNTYKTVKRRSKGRHFIFTYLVILVVLGYLVAQFFNFMNQDTTNYISAQMGEIVDTFSAQGVLVREEQLVKATQSGIVEYYYPGGKELQKGTLVVSMLDDYYGDILQEKIDEIYAEIADIGDTEYDDAFASLDTSINQTVAQYLRNKGVNNYSTLYHLQTNLRDAVSQRKDMYALMGSTRIAQLLAEQEIYLGEQTSVVSNMYLASAGVIDYSYDGYEGWTVEQIGNDFIDNYDSTYSYFEANMQSIQAGAPLYRLITSPVWSIVVYLTEEEAAFFNGTSTISFIYNSSDKLTGRVTKLEQVAYDMYKLVITCTERIQDFMTDRTATLVFSKNSHKGIKISDSCLVQREYLIMPKDYLMMSGDEYGVMVQGAVGNYFQPIDVQATKDETVYFSLPEGESSNITIMMEGTDETMRVGETGYLYGVYLINGGFEQFRSVNIKYQAQGYCIVEGITLYDRVKIIKQ